VGVIPQFDLGYVSLLFQSPMSMIKVARKENSPTEVVIFPSFSFNGSDRRLYFMKWKKEKFKRIVKYWRVKYQQASGNERLFAGMFVLMMLAYAWWAMLVF
jgi:hypothetical protein